MIAAINDADGLPLSDPLVGAQMQTALERTKCHLLLQIRTRTLNGDLASTFCNSYPEFSIADEPVHPHRLAA